MDHTTRGVEMAAKTVSKGNTHEAPTAQQLSYAESLAVKAGYPRAYAVSAARKAMRGKSPVGDMKRAECSELIDFLKAKVEG
jgi:hypothetical protein